MLQRILFLQSFCCTAIISDLFFCRLSHLDRDRMLAHRPIFPWPQIDEGHLSAPRADPFERPAVTARRADRRAVGGWPRKALVDELHDRGVLAALGVEAPNITRGGIF
jgi:hypothetical protein